MYNKVKLDVNFPELEQRILALWNSTNAFKILRTINKNRKHWSFIDGPLTANNPMGVHHAWGRTYKDLFQRFNSMKGYNLRFQNGFDCQGLWIEVEVEKELGFKSKRDIEAFGIAEFVKRCKQRALKFSSVQTRQSIRLGYWMDWDNPSKLEALAENLNHPERTVEYTGTTGEKVVGTAEQIVGKLGTRALGGSYYTMSDDNNYSIWAFLQKCHERGWIYKGTDIMPWCPRCSTALSEHEIATEGYKEIVHSALTVKFHLKNRPGEALLVWTTTPWTLTSNVAVAVNPTITYVKVRSQDEILYLAKATLPKFFGTAETLQELSGNDLLGLEYNGPFDELDAVEKSGTVGKHRVVPWTDVSEVEGTGLVHIAPGAGKEDFELGKQYGLTTLSPINEYGIFVEGYGEFTGVHVYDSPRRVIKALETKGLIFKVEQYSHRYPVCWRCGSELVFRLVDEWFISMGKKLEKLPEELAIEEKQENLRYQIMEITSKIQWIPSYGMSRELDWLRNMSDWMISKKRYWGLALPIWECKKCGKFEVIGNKEELKSRAVSGWDTFEGHSPHKPWIDSVTIRCPRCSAEIPRIQDVGNPWLDAGIVAYSTLSYFTDRKYWEDWFPADLICESLPGQFRNWFYSLLAMSTVLENSSPTRFCFGHGSVLAEDGSEMHKSAGNAIWFDDAVEKMGADVMRWMYCTTRPETDMRFGYKQAEDIKRRFVIPLWNIYAFFTTYANLDYWKPNSTQFNYSLLDKWLLSKLQILIQDVTSLLESYDPASAALRLELFVDQLSKWYLRRSRRRFWKSEADSDKNAAYTTLYTSLVTLAKLLSPFTPFVTEEIYQNLVRSVDSTTPVSIHHCKWPTVDQSLIENDITSSMDLAAQACSLGHSARNDAGIKLRQPLSRAIIISDETNLKRLETMKEVIKDEVNVKELDFAASKQQILEHKLKLRPQLLGAKYGKAYPAIKSKIESMDQSSLTSRILNGQNIEFEADGHPIIITPDDVEVTSTPRQGLQVVEEGLITFALNTEITDDLRNEGLARDIVRRIQNQRKEAGFEISEEIMVYFKAGPRITRVFTEFAVYIAAETLAKKMAGQEIPTTSHQTQYSLYGETMEIGLERA